MNETNAQTKVTVIYHRADFDGIFCREIARKFLGDQAEYIGWDHGDSKLLFPKEGTVYVLDLSPDCFETIPVPGGLRLVWIDHHASSIAKWDAPNMGRIAGYRIDGVAACRLAWQWFALGRGDKPHLQAGTWNWPTKEEYFNHTVSEPLAVRLAGEYDVWDHRTPDALVFQFGLRSVPIESLDWRKLLSTGRTVQIKEIEEMIEAGHPPLLTPDGKMDDATPYVDGLLSKGRPLYDYQQERDASLVKRGYLLEFEGLKFLALNTAFCNSLTFAARDVPATGHDALLAYYFDGTQWKVSLYHAQHNTGVDLSVIAARFGGGGHKGACGFHWHKIDVEYGFLWLHRKPAQH